MVRRVHAFMASTIALVLANVILWLSPDYFWAGHGRIVASGLIWFAGLCVLVQIFWSRR